MATIVELKTKLGLENSTIEFRATDNVEWNSAFLVKERVLISVPADLFPLKDKSNLFVQMDEQRSTDKGAYRALRICAYDDRDIVETV